MHLTSLLTAGALSQLSCRPAATGTMTSTAEIRRWLFDHAPFQFYTILHRFTARTSLSEFDIERCLRYFSGFNILLCRLQHSYAVYFQHKIAKKVCWYHCIYLFVYYYSIIWINDYLCFRRSIRGKDDGDAKTSDWLVAHQESHAASVVLVSVLQ